MGSFYQKIPSPGESPFLVLSCPNTEPPTWKCHSASDVRAFLWEGEQMCVQIADSYPDGAGAGTPRSHRSLRGKKMSERVDLWGLWGLQKDGHGSPIPTAQE